MSLSGILINQILVIFIIILTGLICYKTRLIDDNTNSKLSDILLQLVNPMVIFVSYQRDFSMDLMEGLLISLVLATGIHLIGILLSYLMIRNKKKPGKNDQDIAVERIASAYANVGFMGIPLIYGIYGSQGVFYVTAYLTMFNIFIWTHGVIVMSGSKGMKLKELVRKLISPTIIAIALGLICFIFQLRVPKVMYEAMDYIASLNTPLAMLIAGVTIGKTNIIKIFIRNLRVYYIALIKLVLIPLVAIGLFIKLPIDDMVKVISIIMAASPSATTVIIFSIKYEKNSVLAAETFALVTLLCVVTIPLIVNFFEFLL